MLCFPARRLRDRVASWWRHKRGAQTRESRADEEEREFQTSLVPTFPRRFTAEDRHRRRYSIHDCPSEIEEQFSTFSEPCGGQKCTVCLDDIEAGQTVALLPCFHRFHQQCLKPWADKSTLCPNCKYDFSSFPQLPDPGHPSQA